MTIEEARAVAHAINDVYHRRFKGRGLCEFAYGNQAYLFVERGFYHYEFMARRELI